MLRDAFYLARMDAAHLLRRRETLLWTFVMPIIFFYFLGTIAGNSSGSKKDNLAVSVPANAGFLADQLLARLDQLGYHVVRTQELKEFLRFRRRLSIPAGFTDSVLAGKPLKIRFDRTGEDMGADYDRVRLDRAVRTTLASNAEVPRNHSIVSANPIAKIAARLVQRAARKTVRRRESAKSRAKATSGPPRGRRKTRMDRPKTTSPITMASVMYPSRSLSRTVIAESSCSPRRVGPRRGYRTGGPLLRFHADGTVGPN